MDKYQVNLRINSAWMDALLILSGAQKLFNDWKKSLNRDQDVAGLWKHRFIVNIEYSLLWPTMTNAATFAYVIISSVLHNVTHKTYIFPKHEHVTSSHIHPSALTNFCSAIAELNDQIQ